MTAMSINAIKHTAHEINPTRPLGSLSNFVVKELPQYVQRLIRGDTEAQDEFVTQVTSLIDEAQKLAAQADSTSTQLMLLDLLMIDTVINVHTIAFQSSVFSELVDDLRKIAQIEVPVLTYELIVRSNPLTDLRTFTGLEAENVFYRGHELIERSATSALTSIGKVLTSDGSFEQLMAGVTASLREINQHMDPIFRMSESDFLTFRPYFEARKPYRGPSGLFSAQMTALSLLLFGRETLDRPHFDAKKNASYYPRGDMPSLTFAFEHSESCVDKAFLPQEKNVLRGAQEAYILIMKKHRGLVHKFLSTMTNGMGTGGTPNYLSFLDTGIKILQQNLIPIDFVQTKGKVMINGYSIHSAPSEESTLSPTYSIPHIINGCWQLAGGHGAIEDDEIFPIMAERVRHGFNTFDCADIYIGVEERLGRFLRYLKQESSHLAAHVQIHTKFVPDLDALRDLTSIDVERIIDRSLKRLGVDTLDLVQFHWWDLEIPGYVEAALELKKLQQKGKIRLIGTTNFDVAQVNAICEAGVSIVSNQVQLSVLDQRPLNRFTDTHEVKLLCYGALAGGFLSETYLGVSEPHGNLENRSLTKYKLIIEEFGGWEEFQSLLKLLKSIADDSGATISQIAMRYVLQQRNVAAVICGFRNDQHFDELRTLKDILLDGTYIEKINNFLSTRARVIGGVYELERDKKGKHASIMKYNLNQMPEKIRP